jgi:hypothetical protein
MKKKPTKKLKTMIIKAPKAPKKNFDLSFSNGENNAVIISALQGLKANEGWQFLSQTMTKNLEWLSERIIDKTGEQGEDLTDADVEKYRIRHRYIKELLNKPDDFIKKLSTTEEKRPNEDPYW